MTMADNTIPFPQQQGTPPPIQAMAGHVNSLLETANAFGLMRAGLPLGLALTAVDMILAKCIAAIPVDAKVPEDLMRLHAAAIETRKTLQEALNRSVLVVPEGVRVNGKAIVGAG
jgi:antitoxin component of RelBE/YafQ-DinJ toxin-antitoxin module